MQIDPANGENGGVARALFINGLNNAKVYAPFAWMSAIKLHTNIRRAAGVGDIRGEHQHTPRETMAECYNEVVAPCVFCADTNQREVRREREMQIRVRTTLWPALPTWTCQGCSHSLLESHIASTSSTLYFQARESHAAESTQVVIAQTTFPTMAFTPLSRQTSEMLFPNKKKHTHIYTFINTHTHQQPFIIMRGLYQ